MTKVAYVDTSALVKLVLDEADSPQMRGWYIEAERVLVSQIGIIETQRAAARRQHDPVHLRVILESIESIDLDPAIERTAATVGPASLKTLDAIHLATALALMPELDAFVTYDDRLAEAARGLGLPVVRPA